MSKTLVVSPIQRLKLSAIRKLIMALHIIIMVATLSTTFEVTRPTIKPKIAKEAKN